MKAKEIYEEIDKIIRRKYRFANLFCESTGRSKTSYSNSYKRATSGGSANLNVVEKILNDLGYELTIQPKKQKNQ